MRPYQKMPFQFSVHKMGRGGKLTPYQFLDLSGKDPRPAFARDLLAACGDAGPIYVYNQSFEGGVLQELAKRLPRQAAALIRLRSRMVDLLPIAKKHYYHPSQNGSWSLKAVLPSIAPDLDYATLDGVHDGGMAMEAYREAIDPVTSPARKAAIERELRAYCERDTLALVRLWQFFTGRVPTA